MRKITGGINPTGGWQTDTDSSSTTVKMSATASRRARCRYWPLRRIARTYGLQDKSLQIWRAASPQRYFDRITEPVLVHHGTQEDTRPIRWSEATVKALYAADKDVTLVT